MLEAAFTAVLERHLEVVRPADLALWSLRGLEVLEPALKPEVQANALVLSGVDRQLASLPVPGTPGPAASFATAAAPTANALTQLYEAAWRSSPGLRRAGAERMLRSGFEELFNHLDPYSRYLTPEEARSARARRVGQSGLGLVLGAGRGGVSIAAIAPGGPAERAGLRIGDRVLAIDGAGLASLDLPAAAGLLEGPPETEVELRIQRAGRRHAVRLLRSLVPPASIRAERRGETLVLRIDAFTTATDTRVTELLLETFEGRTPRPRALVLDLRGNRGGLLGQAVAVASSFLASGLVARTGGRHPDAVRAWEAPGPDLTDGVPMVVLVDGRTASAAEILAAALADRGRAVVVGSTTLGKGLIQAVVPLPNGGELLVTWSRVLAPRGWPIQGLGVMPTLCTSLGQEATWAALGTLRGGGSPLGPALARHAAARPPVPASEVAELRRACPPAEGRDADLAAAQALLASPPALAAALGRR